MKKATIFVNGHAQLIGDCKYVELEKDRKEGMSIREELPSKKSPKSKTNSTTKKTTIKKES